MLSMKQQLENDFPDHFDQFNSKQTNYDDIDYSRVYGRLHSLAFASCKLLEIEIKIIKASKEGKLIDYAANELLAIQDGLMRTPFEWAAMKGHHADLSKVYKNGVKKLIG